MLANYITGESEFPSSVLVGESPHFAVAILGAWRCAPIRGLPHSERSIEVSPHAMPRTVRLDARVVSARVVNS